MKVQQGSAVSVHYTGTFADNGEVFDSSVGKNPLEFVMGQGMLLPAFEKAVLGCEVGDVVKASLTPEEGYGTHTQELVMTVPLTDFPEHITPSLGLNISLSTEVPLEGGGTEPKSMEMVITHIDEETATLDANHPLAGKSLEFTIEVVAIG